MSVTGVFVDHDSLSTVIDLRFASARNIDLREFKNHLSLEPLLDLLVLYISETYDLNRIERAYLHSQLPSTRFTIHPSAVATYYAPSDYSGTSGMHREHIRAVPTWRKGPGRYDTVFIRTNSEADTITAGLEIGRICQFFSFSLSKDYHRCALVHEFELVGDGPDNDTGMWIVQPLFQNLRPRFKIIPLDQIFRAAHLIPVYDGRIPKNFDHTETLDNFEKFFVNKFIDYHSFQTAL